MRYLYNTLFLKIHQPKTDCHIHKNKEGLNNILFKVDLIPICFWCLMHQKDHIVGHKSRLHKPKNVELIQKASPDHNIMNSVINTKIRNKSPSI